MSHAPTEGWILAGAVDGVPCAPDLLEDVAGLPHVLRTALELALAGCTRVVVVWLADEPPPDLSAVAADPRLAARARLEVSSGPPGDGASPTVLIARGDRIFHRDLPKLVARGIASGSRPVVEVHGAGLDGAVAAERAIAIDLAEAARQPQGLATALDDLRARDRVEGVPPPWLGFCVAAPDRASVRAAERQLVRSLRKTADGFAARALNRHISLFFTRLLMRTGVHPNVMTLCAFAAAFSGGLIIARGGYTAGVIGMLLVELGSILDGIDGELARLTCRFTKLGQWMDTVTDDISNLCYWTGCMLSVRMTGVDWALPVWTAGVIAFVLTQATQYVLIAVVYDSGDLAAIPWAFQSTEFLSARPRGLWARLKAGAPKLLKRDFAVTLFVACAIAGRLDVVLLISAAGAVGFLVAFTIQIARAWPSWARADAAQAPAPPAR